MKRIVMVFVVFIFCAAIVNAQSTIFFNGEIPNDMSTWAWSFYDDAAVQTPISNIGYTPGTSALKWGTAGTSDWPGVMVYVTDYATAGVDMSSSWETDSVYFKMKAPAGLDPTDPDLNVLLYDPARDMADWDNTVYYTLDNFQDLADGSWHQFAIPLKDFQEYTNPFDRANIAAVSFEYFEAGISTQIYIDKIWIGKPDVPVTMVLFNGQMVMPGASFDAWGFSDNNLVLADGEGHTTGTPAILWETSNWDWQGKGFTFDPQDLSYSWTADSMNIKINAPAGINNLALVWYDWSDNTASITLDASVVTWDGSWQSLSIPLSDFGEDDGFDRSMVYYFSIEAADATIPEKVLIDDIWLGTPSVTIDITAPPNPANVIIDVSSEYVNLIAWDNIASEVGETYDVYGSMNPISDLDAADVFPIELGVEEGDLAVHNLYYPLMNSEISYYYAVTCTDAASNNSPGFSTSGKATNTAQKRAVVNYGAPSNFVLDGYFDDWSGIMPFNIHPDPSRGKIIQGTISDSTDFSANCYLAMDNTYLYMGFDVLDDVFAWDESNTVNWWDDESIEFFIGFYQIYGNASHHTGWERGAEPDYRIVFTPEYFWVDAWPSADTSYAGSENYYFESGGSSDYYIEAKIPLATFASIAGDDLYTPVDGMQIPLEIEFNDADVVDGGTAAKIQYGINSGESPWHNAPNVWTYTWIGTPDLTAVENNKSNSVRTFMLNENHPNPFNPSTTIAYTIPQNGNVKLQVFNMLGQNVETLVNEHQTPGSYTVSFDASSLQSGVYFYKLSMKNYTQIKKMLLLK